jgi:hypothetical protein
MVNRDSVYHVTIRGVWISGKLRTYKGGRTHPRRGDCHESNPAGSRFGFGRNEWRDLPDGPCVFRSVRGGRGCFVSRASGREISGTDLRAETVRPGGHGLSNRRFGARWRIERRKSFFYVRAYSQFSYASFHIMNHPWEPPRGNTRA